MDSGWTLPALWHLTYLLFVHSGCCYVMLDAHPVTCNPMLTGMGMLVDWNEKEKVFTRKRRSTSNRCMHTTSIWFDIFSLQIASLRSWQAYASAHCTQLRIVSMMQHLEQHGQIKGHHMTACRCTCCLLRIWYKLLRYNEASRRKRQEGRQQPDVLCSNIRKESTNQNPSEAEKVQR